IVADCASRFNIIAETKLADKGTDFYMGRSRLNRTCTSPLVPLLLRDKQRLACAFRTSSAFQDRAWTRQPPRRSNRSQLRPRNDEQDGLLQYAQSALGTYGYETEIQDPNIRNRDQLEDEHHAFTGIDADDHKLQ